jgi:hypothetical protein
MRLFIRHRKHKQSVPLDKVNETIQIYLDDADMIVDRFLRNYFHLIYDDSAYCYDNM